jgi:hypothetical protein
MMPACPPPAPNPFRAPLPAMSSRRAMLWLSPRRHASESWHLVGEKTAQDPSVRWGDDVSNWIN